MRSDWAELPADVREAIKARTGSIIHIEPAAAGNHADIASTLHTSAGRVFVKAARKLPDQDGPEVKSLRWEAAINPYVIEHAPRLHWTVEAGGWLALGFQFVQARHAEYAPGSSDLVSLAKVIETFQGLPCPAVLDNKRVERRWKAVSDDVSPFVGDSLIHGDLNPANVLITAEGRVYIVDWSFTCRGAAWVELGLLIPWLLKAGHSPSDTNAWISRFPSWTSADPAHIDLFTRVFSETWRNRSSADPATSWKAELADLVGRWADYRLRGQ